MRTYSLESFISGAKQTVFNNSMADVELVTYRKEKPNFDINQEINNRTFIRPLPPKGHIVRNGILSAPLNQVQNLKTDITSLKAAVSGEANDYQLGKLNDLGMKIGGLGIATYLFSMKHAPVTKAMEFIGFAAFFSSMALWPRLALGLPARIIHGFNPFIKYEDSQGRKKGFFSDNQFIPFDMLSEKDINRVGKRLHVPQDIPNRREAIEEKMRQIALQNNTLWMLTAGFATPIMSSLICNRLEPYVEDLHNFFMNRRVDNILEDFSQTSKKYTSKKIIEDINNIIELNKDKSINPELIEKLSSALTQELDNNVKLGIKQDLSDLFLDGKFKISEKQVSEMYQSVSELIKLASDNKLTTDVLRSVTPNIEQIKNLLASNEFFTKSCSREEISGIISQLSELIARNISDANANGASISPHTAKKITMGIANPPAKGNVKSIENILTASPASILDSDRQMLLRKLAGIMTEFSAENTALNKYAYHKLALAPDTAKAKYWNDFTKSLIKILNISHEDIENTRLDRKLVSKMFNDKIWQKATANEAEYKNFVETIAANISQIEKYVKPDEINGRFMSQVEESFSAAATKLRNNGFRNTAKRITGENYAEAGTLLGATRAYIRDNLTNIRSTFSSILNKVNVYRSIYKNPDLSFISAENLPKEIKEEIVALAEYLTSEGGYGEYAVKFDFLRNANPNMTDTEKISFSNGKISYNYYDAKELEKSGIIKKSDVTFFKRVMNLLFGTPVNQETKDALVQYSSVSGMLDTYREKMLNVVGNTENYMYPDSIVDNSRRYSWSSPKMNSNLTGTPLDDVLTNTIRKTFNSNKWLKTYCKFGGILLGITLVSQFLFGKNPNYKKERTSV